MSIRTGPILLLFLLGTALAETGKSHTQFVSGADQVSLVELYTSEGCSSCPPADRWLSELTSDPGLWTEFVPVAWHVDYWDYIGWKDRFSSSEYSDRQKRYVSEGGANVVYTPGFFVNGQEWRSWRGGRPVPRGNSVPGNLSVRVDGEDILVHFETDEHSAYFAHVALLGMNIETRVRAGENAGRTLQHDFLLLGVTSKSLDAKTGKYSTVVRLPSPSVEHDELALVAWVSEADSQAPVQAVGGYLPGI